MTKILGVILELGISAQSYQTTFYWNVFEWNLHKRMSALKVSTSVSNLNGEYSKAFSSLGMGYFHSLLISLLDPETLYGLE